MTIPQGILPVLALKNTVIYPGLSQMVRVGRERSVQALQLAQKNGFWIVAVQQRNAKPDSQDQVEPQDLYNVGTICRIDSMKGTPETGYQVVLRGFNRVELSDVKLHAQGYLEASANTLDESTDVNEATRIALLESLKKLSLEILQLIPGNTDHVRDLVQTMDDLSHMTYLAAGNLELGNQEKQKLLEINDLKDRVLHLLNLMNEFRNNLDLQTEIRSKIHQKLGQAQRQTILREQLKTIREELGESDAHSSEEKYHQKIQDAKMPEEVRKIAEQELRRLGELGNNSPESHIIRNYLDLLVSLPWAKSAEHKEINLDDAEAILNADHEGLSKIKKRILEHLAIMKLKNQSKGSILLFVGPPGVGKTSLGQSIAKTLGRKFVRVSFGGLRDDAEIRGHRRTYIGAMPGRIIQGLKKSGENNPVFLLDEIDKLSRSYNGDPASALLEVLDPEQNSNFLDHYLDTGFDLSNVFFIATANTLDGIPAPLLDRMEVIEVTGYTVPEKLHIAKKHLVPKQLEEFGMSSEKVQIEDSALMKIITSYTREAGVRDLKRQIAAVLRGKSGELLKEPAKIKIAQKDLDDVLGSERFVQEVTDVSNPPGVATGLAWTPVGGDILFIESTAMPGKGDYLITGQLGDVMKESARVALTLIKSHLSTVHRKFNLDKVDLHIHIPAGAIPKDGPSAGVTLLTSLCSLITGRPVPSTLAMTGEVTLRGAVLPVGGIKEKVIAAHRAGVKTIVMSKKNEKDLREIPDDVKQQLQFIFVDTVAEVLKHALGVNDFHESVLLAPALDFSTAGPTPNG